MTAPSRYRLDGTVQRHGHLVVGGSPLRLFRLTDAGARLVDRIAAGDAVADSTLVDRLLDAGAIHPEPSPDTGPYGPADVTLVVPTLGPPGAVPPGAIVVDDGSVPPVPGATIRLEVNRGAGAARTAGLERVVTPLVAFVDADVVLGDGWLEPLLPHFADERVALVAPRVRSSGATTALERYEAGHSPLDLGDQPAGVRPGSRVGYVPAAAIVCRTEAVREIGGFDPDLRFGEDVDLVWRLVAAGWRVRYEPASTVLHHPRAGWRAWARQRIGYGSSAAPLARRHPGALAPLRMSGWSLGSWALGAAGRPLLGAGLGVGSAAALIAKLPDLPPRAAFRLAGLGNLHAGDQLASAVRRVWWPIVALAALRSRTARTVLAGAVLGARNPLRLADDLAYSVGVWAGMLAERTLEPIVPEITSWPGRQQAGRPGRRWPTGYRRSS